MDIATAVQAATLTAGGGIAVHAAVKELVRLFSRRDTESDQRAALKQRQPVKGDN